MNSYIQHQHSYQKNNITQTLSEVEKPSKAQASSAKASKISRLATFKVPPQRVTFAKLEQKKETISELPSQSKPLQRSLRTQHRIFPIRCLDSLNQGAFPVRVSRIPQSRGLRSIGPAMALPISPQTTSRNSACSCYHSCFIQTYSRDLGESSAMP